MNTNTRRFVSMAAIIPVGKAGNAAVEHFEVDAAAASFSAMREAIGHAGEYVPAGRYARLVVDGHVMMSDTLMERHTSDALRRRAHGDVLIAGLGLGLVLVPLAEAPEVNTITVVEINEHVVDLVWEPLREALTPAARDKLRIVLAPIEKWRPAKGRRFNTIYFDIWPSITTDNLPDIALLHRAFARFLDRTDPDAWMSSWQVAYLRAMQRAERAAERVW